MNNSRQQQRNGFTLVEVAIVIVFMGIFITFASSMLKGIALSSKYRTARDKLATTSDAVQAWANQYRRLPTKIAGLENFDTVLSQPLDYWNKKYTFQPYDPIAGAVSDICRQSSTNLSVCLGDTCTGSNFVKDIAYVIISGGDNLTVNPAWLVTASPCSASNPCVPIKDLSTTNDDLFKYVTLLELKKTAGCVEADSRLRILNSELPWALETVSYSVAIQAEGGAMFTGANKYKWCVNGAAPSDLVYSPSTLCTDPAGPTAAPSFNITRSTTVNSVHGITSTPSVTVSVWDANNVKVDKTFVLTIVNP